MNRKKTIPLLICLIPLLWSPLFACYAQEFNILDGDEGMVNILEHSSILRDTDSLTIREIAKSTHFVPSKGQIIRSDGNSVIWVRFGIINKSTRQPLLLIIKSLSGFEAGFYIVNEFDKITDSLALYGRESLYPNKLDEENALFELNLSPGDSALCYLSIAQPNTSHLSVTVQTTRGLYERTQNTNIVIGIHIGLVLLVLLGMVWLSLFFKDAILAHFTHYLFWSFYLSLSLLGLLDWPSHDVFGHYLSSLSLSFSLTIITLILFSLNFFHLKKRFPVYYIITIIIVIIHLLLLVSTFFGFYTQFYTAKLVLTIVTLVALLAFSVYSYPAYPLYRGFVVAWSALLCVFLGASLWALDILNFNPSAYQVVSVSIIQLVCVCFIFSTRLKILDSSQQEIQDNLLRIARLNNELILNQKTELEKRVLERTADLYTVNQNLEETLSNLKITQSQLINSKKMESLSRLANSLAHEINNPANFISINTEVIGRNLSELYLFIELIAKELENPDTILDSELYTQLKRLDYPYLKEENNISMQAVREGVERAINIVRGIESFARINIKGFGDIDTIALVISIVKKQLQGSSIKFTLEAEAKTLPRLNSSCSAITTIFENIILNAIVAIRQRFEDQDGGELTIRIFVSEKRYYFIISDNGIGIDPENMEAVLEPFFSVASFSSGIGMGLSIAYQLVKHLDGDLLIHSEKNVGTKLTVWVPCKSE